MKYSIFEAIMRFVIPIILFVTIFSFGCGNSRTENAGKGELLFNSAGCKQCHSLTGDTSLYGPPLNSIYKKEVVVLRGAGKVSVTIDRDYIIRSITNPDMERLSGYETKKMPPVNLKPEEIGQLADYLISISDDQQLKNP